jgi:NhaA family Na+:H+ antiporter
MTTEHDIDDALDTSGADEALSTFARRIRAVRSRPAPTGPAVLTPPISLSRDHVEGPEWAPSLVVFGSYGTPASRPLGRLLAQLREAHPASLRLAWRHLPAVDDHPRAVALALAAEAAAAQSRFWSMNRELLAMHHDDLEDLHAAARRADVDFYRLLDRMRAGVGADRIVSDVESARASAVASAPTLFVNGKRFSGDLDAPTVWAALHDAPSEP